MLSIVMPAFNEANNIKGMIQETLSVLKKTRFEDNFEIIVVDDHSDDETYQNVEWFQNPRINCIRLSRRSGSHVALRAGLAQAKGQPVLCLSADGQDDPNALLEMLKKWEEGHHIVWALRSKRKEAFIIKGTALVFYKILSFLTDIKKTNIDISRADFYLLDEKVVDSINRCRERNTSLFGLIQWMGFRQAGVEYSRRERKHGKSGWNFRRRFQLMRDWIVAFSGLPLKIMSLIGIVVAFIGFFYAVFIAIHAIIGNPVPGWASLMIVVLILTGLQMIMLGVVGEYLWRSLVESRKRPLYFIENSTLSSMNENNE